MRILHYVAAIFFLTQSFYPCFGDVVPLGSPVTYAGHTYQLLSRSNWTDAELKAQEFGGHLVTIDDENENEFVRATFGSGKNLWLGLNDIMTEGQFVWADGSSSAFRKWQAGEPNNDGGNEDYVGMYGWTSHGSWNDLPNVTADASGSPLHGVVEVAAPVPTPTAASAGLALLAGSLLSRRWRPGD